MLQTPGRVVVYSWKGLARNAWIGLATVFVFFMALLSVNILMSLQAMIDRTVTILEQKVDVTVNFKPDAPEAVVTQAKFYLSSLPQVTKVELTEPDVVLERFKERHNDETLILAGVQEVGTNPFGAQLTVRAKSPDDYDFLIQAIENPQYRPHIESQSYQDHKLTIDRIRTISDQARLIGSLLVAVFALFGALVAFNTIRIAIYTQREEISIMRLVGASTRFIKAPFMLEGVWLAVIALALSLAAAYGLAFWMEPLLHRSLFDGVNPGILDYFRIHWPVIVAAEGGGLVLLSMMVSWAAVGKYIKR